MTGERDEIEAAPDLASQIADALCVDWRGSVVALLPIIEAHLAAAREDGARDERERFVDVASPAPRTRDGQRIRWETDRDIEARAVDPEESCCHLACSSGACETCPCCLAGWCVFGLDLEIPTDPEGLAYWLDVASEHNPVAALLAADREALERVRALLPPHGDVSAFLIRAALDGQGEVSGR